jgi:hypothetical protein
MSATAPINTESWFIRIVGFAPIDMEKELFTRRINE